MFIEQCDLSNYADDNTLDVCNSTIDLVIYALQNDAKNAIKWFEENFMEVNPNKFQAMFLKSPYSPIQLPSHLVIGDVTIETKSSVDLLGLIIDDKLKFDQQVSKICLKAARQLNVLFRFKNIFKGDERKMIYNTFIYQTLIIAQLFGISVVLYKCAE